MLQRALVLVAILAAAPACKRPSAEACEEALRNYFSLLYWEQAEAEIAAAPPEKREQLRVEKLADRDKKLEEGMTFGISQCRAARDFDGVKCMREATTPAQARKCREPWKK